MDVADILSDIDDHGFGDTATARKLEVINETYWDVCGREPWPFLEKFYRLSFDGSNPFPTDLPSDFRAVTSMKFEGGTKIDWVRHDEFEQRFGEFAIQTGVPYVFYFVADELNFYPVPASGARVRMGYIMTPPELASDDVEAEIIIPKQFHRGLLVNGALYRLYAMEDDLTLAQGFERYFEKTLQNMSEFVWRRQYANNDIVHPVDPDDLGWE